MSAFDTRALHDGEPAPRVEGAVSLPIFQTTTYTHTADEPLRYVRLNNSPNHEALNNKLASLTETEQALVTASGMAAISSTLLTLLDAGDHLVAPETLYGGTLALFDTLLPRLGIEHSVLPTDDPATWHEALTDDTTVLYAESIGNPLLEVPDLEAMASFAEKHGLVSVIDNTFACPVNLRPATLGFDVVLHSATKYLGGHSDVAAGVIAGPASLLDGMAHTLTLTGGMLDPHACFLLHRSLKTLGVRMERHNAAAQSVAATLADHGAVSTLYYPGHPTHPHHDRAAALFDGYGGMVSFELGAGADPERFFDHLTLPIRAPSLGGVESLVTQPAHTSHRDLDPAKRQALGITERLIRLSVGLEDPEDLVTDLTEALNASRTSSG